MAIYSTRFGDGTLAASVAATLYTVPAGNTAVLRQVTLTPIGAGVTTLQIYRAGASILVALINPTDLLSYSQEGRWVLNAGESIDGVSNGAASQWHLSGYLLTP